jgi:hypothetical protein
MILTASQNLGMGSLLSLAHLFSSPKKTIPYTFYWTIKSVMYQTLNVMKDYLSTGTSFDPFQMMWLTRFQLELL